MTIDMESTEVSNVPVNNGNVCKSNIGDDNDATSQRHMQRKKKNPRNEKASECCCLVNRADKMK